MYNDEIKKSIAIQVARAFVRLKAGNKTVVRPHELETEVLRGFGRKYMPTEMICRFVTENIPSQAVQRRVKTHDMINYVEDRWIKVPA